MLKPAPLLNPYFDLFAALQDSAQKPGQSAALSLELRKKLIWAYAWAIPDQTVIRQFAQSALICEWGAGTGYWAWLLEQAGARVRAFEIEPAAPPHWHPLERARLECVAELGDHALLFCWPPLATAMALEALELYRGQTVLYVGEWRGRTADSAFHDALETHWRIEWEYEIPHWPGFRDRAYRFTRK